MNAEHNSLPIAVAGALFSVGDGHARQGDGEASHTGIECPMDKVSLTFFLGADQHLSTPRAHTPAGWLTFGFAANLDSAAQIALDAMLALMGELQGFSRVDALALASVVDMRITQMVNGVVGVHALLPHDLIIGHKSGGGHRAGRIGGGQAGQHAEEAGDAASD